MPLLAILANPAVEARKALKRAPFQAGERNLLRLVQMSLKARTAISRALKARPLAVHISGPKGEYVRFRLKDPKGYKSFALIVLSPKEIIRRFQAKYGRRPTPTEAKTMLGPIGAKRLTLGVIGRKDPGKSELQSVLVPKARVFEVAKKYAIHQKVKKPVVALNPRKRKVRKNSVILPAVVGGATAAVVGSFIQRRLQASDNQKSRSTGTWQREFKIPFRPGRKYSVASVHKWVMKYGTPDIIRRWKMALAQYRRFHKGSPPNYVTYHVQTLGASREITDVDFGVSEGKEWLAAYQVPRTSGKWADEYSDGRYIHAHGESNIDVDVKSPVSPKKLPERFHTPDGKFVGVIPSRNVKITDWYRG